MFWRVTAVAAAVLTGLVASSSIGALKETAVVHLWPESVLVAAGGHLAVRVSTNFKTRSYAAVDKCDEASCRPDFSIPIYPAYLTADEKSPFDEAGLPVSAETPPTFMAVAFKEKFSYGAIQYELALKKAGAASELHIFQFGGHGCGLRKTDANLTTWPELCERWMRGIKVLAKP